MEGKCKRDLESLICQTQHIRNNAAGGHRHIPLADIQSVFICQHADKPDKIIIVIQRFPGSHDNNV